MPTLQRWIDGSLPMIAVSGKPGSGKSVLSKYLVRHFTPPPGQHPRGEAIASFFFSDRGSKHQKSVQGFLQSLVHQILNQIWPLFRHILPTYHDVKNNGGEIWSTETLKQVLISMITDPRVKSIRLVIDAFEECDAEDELLDLIFRDLIKPQSRVQVLITSRPNNALDQEIKDDQKIILEDLNVGDIRNYIEKVLEDLKQSPKFQHYASAMGDFRELLISLPRGVFLWAKLAMEELKKRMRNGSTVPDLKKMLGGLPGDLGGFYGHMFQNIINANVESEARKMLIWVLYVERPLTLEEIQYASAISTPDFSPSSFAEIESSGHLKTPEMMERSLRSICGGFLEVKPISPNGPAINTEDNTGSNRFIQLIHQSAKEFLLKKKFPESPSTPSPPLWITPYDAHDHILQTCIAYLTLSDLEPWKQDCFLPFQEYTAYKWVNHAWLIDRSGEKSYLEKLEKPEREEYRRFLSYIENGDEGAYNSPLTLASTIGLLGDVKRLLAKKKYGEEVLGDALNAAATYNHEGVVDILISKGANINFSWEKNSEKMTTLQTAILKGQKSMTQSLIEKGADVKLEGGKYWTALQVAAYVGDLELVELFTKMGADVNAEGGKFWTALQAAATSGYGEVVKLLIEKGANMNATGGEYGTALQAAAYGGNREIMQHLITNNADIKVVGGEFGTLLQAAAFWGNEGSVQTLISNGADVNAVGGRYGTALQAAIYGTHENIMRILIDNGADMKTVGGEYGTLLQTAASRGAEEIVKFLIDSGADVDVIGGYYGTALQAAAECGHEGIVGSLCDKGANVNLIAGHYGTAIQAAAFFGHQGAITFLISKGANVNAKGGYYGTALQAAAYGGHEEVLQLLIHSGADVDAVGGEFGTALQAAVFQGYEQVVRFLVDDCKAKLDLMGGNFGTALQAAMVARRSNIVEFLTQKAAEESR